MTKTILKIDMDLHPSKQWMQFYKETRKTMLEKLGFKLAGMKVFKTRRGIHIYMTIKGRKITDKEKNMFQWLLGDDHTRVKINQWRILKGIPHWNKLFHKVLYRKKAKVLTCHYCGNVIPVPDHWFKNNNLEDSSTNLK